MRNSVRSAVFIAVSGLASTAGAAEMYLAGSLSSFDRDSSNNSGSFVTDFTTGAVTGVTPPLTIPTGAPVGWTTHFGNDMAYSLALGWELDTFRVEIEYSTADSDIRSHEGVSAAGIDLTAIDAGVLLTGNVGDLGVSVGDLVASGTGSVDSRSVFVNAYYDFMKNEAFSPYIGFGLGYTTVDVVFAPSSVGVIDDTDSTLAYQLILGASYALSEETELFGSIQLRDGEDAAVYSPLLTASFDVENESTLFTFGIRYNF